MQQRLPRMFSHPVSLIGLVIAVFNAGFIVFLSVVEAFSRRAHPYADLVIWLILPALVLLGLVLIVSRSGARPTVPFGISIGSPVAEEWML